VTSAGSVVCISVALKRTALRAVGCSDTVSLSQFMMSSLLLGMVVCPVYC
jgi:hypothetical protein